MKQWWLTQSSRRSRWSRSPDAAIRSSSNILLSGTVALAAAIVPGNSISYAQTSGPQQQTGAAQLTPGAPQSGADRKILLSRVVTMSLTDVTLETALLAIQEQSGVVIAYGDRVVPLTRRVSIAASQMPVIAAVQTLLKGTNVGVKVSTGGKLVLYEHIPSAQDSVFGLIAGRVVEVSKKGPLPLVRISIEGSTRAVLTNDRGDYVIPRVPAGKYTIVARLFGYGVAQKSITVTGSDTARTDFTLSAIPKNLQEVVTTGAGDRQRLEVGHATTSINADSIVRTTPLRSLSDLLQSRAPGTQVSTVSGTVGSGSRIRIRGIASVLTNSDPILIIDGVRVDAMYSQRTTGDANTNQSVASNRMNDRVPATSRLDDLDPEMIETIEVLRGPSASTLYGSDAANGVIVVKTKRGKAGPTRWSGSITQGRTSMKATFPDAWLAWGSSALAPGPYGCSLAQAVALECTIDSLTHYNPLNVRESSPFGTGRSSAYNLQVSGGVPQLQYFLGGTYSDQLGFLRMPDTEREYLMNARGGSPLPEWADRPNVQKVTTLTTTVTAQTSPKLDLTLNGNFSSRYHRDATQGTSGFVSKSLTSAGYRDPVGQGWGVDGPALSFLERNSDAVKRLSGGVNVNFRPFTILAANAVFGADYTSRHDDQLLRSADVAGTTATSMRGRDDSENLGRTANVTTTLNVPIVSQLRVRSTVGGQYSRFDDNGITARGRGLPMGSDVITSASTIDPPQERRSATATAGWFFDEAFSLRERMFMTVALRGDAGSSFGRSAKPMLYPKFNGSWVVSQEDFFPKINAVNNVRLRGAFGQAGVQPGVEARFRSFRPWTSYPSGVSTTGINIVSVGNANLVPERSTEYEGGVDIGFFDDRLSFEGTSYYKVTRNALIQRPLPPSIGLPSRQENIGEVENRGLELLATVRPLVGQKVDLSMTMGFSRNSNKLVKLGTDTMSTSLPSQTRYVAGYPVNGLWGRPIAWYADVDGDGMLSSDEVQLSDSSVYVGQPIPKAELSFHTNASFFSGRVSVAAGFVFQDGLTQYNQAMWAQCQSARCRIAVDSTVSLADQAMLVSISKLSYYAGYETVSWLRWNDLSVTFRAPSSFVRRLRGRDASVSLMGRNLAMWSKYRGADPEVNTTRAGNHTQDQGGVPQSRDWSIRFNINY